MDELDLRASDEERDRAVTELRRHLVDGRLSMEEFDQRADEALRARTRRDLVATTRELPHLPDPGQARAASRAERIASAGAALPALLPLLPALLVIALVTVAWASGAWWLLWLIWPALALSRRAGYAQRARGVWAGPWGASCGGRRRDDRMEIL